MTMRFIPPMRHGSRHDAPEPTMPHCPQPGSPTLTNPDMILPDYNELLGYNDLPQPPRQKAWNAGHAIQAGFQFTDSNFYVNPDPFTTPIIYGNGTMLSDIGEVTEVESNAGTLVSRNASRRTAHGLNDAAAMPRQTHAIARANKPRLSTASKVGRHFSTDSTSTIGTSDRGPFADFDDTVSTGGDSIFQGDDEESTTSSYADDLADSHPHSVSIRRSSDEAEANSMSRRAEEILANAKQRLTDMEDNLSRARTLSYSTARKEATTPSLGQIASTYHQGRPAPAQPAVAQVHGRNMSENGLAHIRSGGVVYQRSASALGLAGGYRRAAAPTKPSADAPSSKHSTEPRGAYTVPQRQLELPLEPLGEDEYAENVAGRLGGMANAAFGIFDHGSPRAGIQVRDLQDQMNGLKGKISSLREQARADSLKRRSLQSLRTPSPFSYADWDTVLTDSRKQHSSDNDPVVAELESMHAPANGNTTPIHERFPSLGAVLDKERTAAAHEPRAVIPRRPIPQRSLFRHSLNEYSLREMSSSAVDEEVTREHEKEKEVKVEGSQKEDRKAAVNVNDGDALHHQGESAKYENHPEEMTRPPTAHQEYESESEESLYHDSFQHQISHEDREDAFDYEHFFLHSCAGNLRPRSESQASADSEGSVESTDSVRTARGPAAPRRRPSVETTASAESFQTATEEFHANRASIASGYRVYMPADLHKKRRPLSTVSVPESSSGSDSTTAHSQDGRRPRPSSVLHRPLSVSTVSTKPSFSSFESTGTTRSFPLVNKSKRNSSVNSISGMLTPGSSPDQGARGTPTSGLREAAPIHAESEQGDAVSRGPSPAIQLLSPTDQATVEALVAGLGKCVLVLGEPGGAATGAHELYRRRIEMARQILEGKIDLP